MAARLAIPGLLPGTDFQFRLTPSTDGTAGCFLRADGPEATVFDDGARDLLTGGDGMDWFLFNQDGVNDAQRDKATDLFAAEFASDLDFINNDE